MARLEELTEEDLPAQIAETADSRVIVSGGAAEDLLSLEEVTRQYVQHVLEIAGGNKSEAARILGLGRRTLYRKLQQWGF